MKLNISRKTPQNHIDTASAVGLRSDELNQNILEIYNILSYAIANISEEGFRFRKETSLFLGSKNENFKYIIWATRSSLNFINLWTYGMALCQQYKNEIGKKNKFNKQLKELAYKFEFKNFPSNEVIPLPI